MAQIVLVTGKPRIGKTAFSVELIMFDDYYKNRKLFSNVNGLKVPHHQPPEGHSWEDLHIWLKYPENVGAVVLFDEVQNLFPARPAGSKMPDNVAWLHVHGHTATDLVFITQSPKVIDLNLRELVGKHIHIAANKVGGLTRLEFNEVALNPTKQSKDAVASIHHIRKEVFEYYQSAEAHTKHAHVKSRWVTVLIVACCITPLIFGLIGWISYRYYQDLKVKAGHEQVVDVQAASQPNLSVLNGQITNVMPEQQKSLRPELYIPTMAEKPESKPLYDSVRTVKQYERIAGCMQSGKSCNCYSDQATRLKEISTELCRSYVKDGLPFDPFRDKPTYQPQTAQTGSVDVDTVEVES